MFKLREIKTKASDFLSHYKQQDPAAYAAAQQAVGGLLIIDGFIGIDNPFGGKKRSGIFGSFVGIIVGILFIFAGSLFLGLTGIGKMTATTTATVVSVGAPVQTSTNTNGSSSSTCSLTARYTVGGREYTNQASDSSSSYCGHSVGDTVTINYNPDKPGSWSMDVATVKLVMKIFSVVGIVVAILSLFTFVIRLLSIIFGWKLLKSGRALAKTLPAGTDLGTAISEIRQSFSRMLFPANGGGTLNTLVNEVAGLQQTVQPVQTTTSSQPVAPTPPATATQPVDSAPAEPAGQTPPDSTPPTPPVA